MKHQIRYGKGYLALEVPDERITGILSPNEVPEVDDVISSVRTAVTQPYGCPPIENILRGKRTALILTVDCTRPSPARLLFPVIEACRKTGVSPTVMIATGRHRQMSPEELSAHLGGYITKHCRVMQHDAFDSGQMITVGKTRRGTAITVNKAIFRHDVIIGTGIIEPSYLCGWSGGRKLLMPGIAHHASIDSNHYLLNEKNAVIGKLHDNPVSDDALEFASALPFHFIVYAITGPNDEFVEIVAGDPVKAHEAACTRCADIYTVNSIQADIVVSSTGGHPYDCDLVQGKKAVIPAIKTVKKNGVIILCAECMEGTGSEETFINWLKSKTPSEVMRDVLDRKQFNLGAHGAKILAMPIVEKNATVMLVTCASVAAQLQGTFIKPFTHITEAWDTANSITGAESKVLFIEKARRLIVR